MLTRIPDQKFTPILEPFCNGPKTEVALINVVQVYCYEDTRIIKAFPQILKVSTRVFFPFPWHLFIIL